MTRSQYKRLMRAYKRYGHEQVPVHRPSPKRHSRKNEARAKDKGKSKIVSGYHWGF